MRGRGGGKGELKKRWERKVVRMGRSLLVKTFHVYKSNTLL